MSLDAPTLQALTTVAGATILTLPISELIKRAWNPTPTQQDRFMPVVSVIIGVAVVLVADFGLGLLSSQDLVGAIVTGLFAGFSASGVYDTYRGFAKTSG
jgi:hypothetical protein